ncbi:MAG: hypothetical protein ACRECQ_18615 [Burkholderiaceae bacterium]
MDMTMHRSTYVACELALVAGTALAQPQGKPREATLGGGSGSGPMLTREQLRECLVEQDELKTARDRLARETQQIDAEKAEIAGASAALKDEEGKLDKTNADAVKAYVEKAQAHDQRIDAWNAKLPAVNERVRGLQERNDKWRGSCADRRYKEDDLILLQARKQVPLK